MNEKLQSLKLNLDLLNCKFIKCTDSYGVFSSLEYIWDFNHDKIFKMKDIFTILCNMDNLVSDILMFSKDLIVIEIRNREFYATPLKLYMYPKYNDWFDKELSISVRSVDFLKEGKNDT